MSLFKPQGLGRRGGGRPDDARHIMGGPKRHRLAALLPGQIRSEAVMDRPKLRAAINPHSRHPLGFPVASQAVRRERETGRGMVHAPLDYGGRAVHGGRVLSDAAGRQNASQNDHSTSAHEAQRPNPLSCPSECTHGGKEAA